MAFVNIRDKVNQSNGKTRLTEIKLDEDVKHLKQRIKADLNLAENLYDAVFCGQCLKEGSSLESSGVRKGSTIYLLAKPEEPTYTPDEISNAEVKQLLSLLQTTLKSPAYRSTVEKIVNSPEILHNIVEDIPGLNNSPSTITLFLDQVLLTVLAHPGNIRRVIEANPCFPQLAQKIAAAVKEADATGEYTQMPSGGYSLDRMSDEEEEEAAGTSTGQQITANQLAAALAAATGSTMDQTESESLASGSGTISSDFFQQAILAAQRGALDSQVQQMREMGITDENVARQALQATNGDIQAALELIFGGGFS